MRCSRKQAPHCLPECLTDPSVGDGLEVGEHCLSSAFQPGTTVFGRCNSSRHRELSSSFEVCFTTASEAEVGVVELPARCPERRLQPCVNVVRDEEPPFGLVVVSEHRCDTSEWSSESACHEGATRNDHLIGIRSEAICKHASGGLII